MPSNSYLWFALGEDLCRRESLHGIVIQYSSRSNLHHIVTIKSHCDDKVAVFHHTNLHHFDCCAGAPSSSEGGLIKSDFIIIGGVSIFLVASCNTRKFFPSPTPPHNTTVPIAPSTTSADKSAYECYVVLWDMLAGHSILHVGTPHWNARRVAQLMRIKFVPFSQAHIYSINIWRVNTWIIPATVTYVRPGV